MIRIPFDNSYVRLPERFYTRTSPKPVRAPKLIHFNHALAEELGIEANAMSSEEGAALFSGSQIPDGAEPISQAYAGHQFGTFVPQLGDGRAVLLGEVIDTRGVRRDVQLKGAGRTPWSRGGDGRAAIGPVLREYIVSEAMNAMGIRTTRSLAAVASGEKVARETMLPGGVLTRVAASHIRVGTFEYFAARQDDEAVRILADHVIARHHPAAREAHHPYVALLGSVVAAQAELIASWLLVGFIHGVMNTDNMTVSGETIDYGPCAFMDEYSAEQVFSSIDRYGRYAYGNQPPIGAWNLTRLAESLLPLFDADEKKAVEMANETLGEYVPTFERAYATGLRRKLGLADEQEGDAKLAQELLTLMQNQRADFTLTFDRLTEPASARELFADPASFDPWLERWNARTAKDGVSDEERRVAMRRANPRFIPRNHRIEAVIKAVVERDDYAPFEEMLRVVTRPYDEQAEFAEYQKPPREEERVLQTFCGT